MRITNRKTRVTDNVVEQVQESIEKDIRERTEAFDEAVQRLERLVEGFADSDVEMLTVTRSLWSALMVVKLRALELIWARRRGEPGVVAIASVASVLAMPAPVFRVVGFGAAG